MHYSCTGWQKKKNNQTNKPKRIGRIGTKSTQDWQEIWNIDLYLHRSSVPGFEKMDEVLWNRMLTSGNERTGSAWAFCLLSVTQISLHLTRTKFLINSLSNQLENLAYPEPGPNHKQSCKLLTSEFFCKWKSYFCRTDTRWAEREQDVIYSSKGLPIL